MNDLAEVRGHLDRMGTDFAKRLPPHIAPERFVAAAFSALVRNRDLLDLNRDSLFVACMDAAEDGLIPDGREGALVPFKGRVSWMPMVGGLVKLAWNCGGLLSIGADAAYQGETFAVRGGTEPGITHLYDLSVRGDGGSLDNVIAVYAVAKTVGGGTMQAVLSPQEVAKIRAGSKASRADSPWNVWPVQMAQVRAIRRLCKLLPLSNDRDADARMRRAAERGDVIDGVAEEAPPDRPAISAPEGGKLAALEQHLDATGPIIDQAPEREASPVQQQATPPQDERDPNWMDQTSPTPMGKPEGDDKPAQAARRWVRLIEACATEEKLDALLSAGALRRDQAWYRDNKRPELDKLIGEALARQFDKVGSFPGDRA